MVHSSWFIVHPALPIEFITMNYEPITELKMEREGFEPSKASADRFTVCSLWPLGYLSKLVKGQWTLLDSFYIKESAFPRST
jgi:hypothetical protein